MPEPFVYCTCSVVCTQAQRVEMVAVLGGQAGGGDCGGQPGGGDCGGQAGGEGWGWRPGSTLITIPARVRPGQHVAKLPNPSLAALYGIIPPNNNNRENNISFTRHHRSLELTHDHQSGRGK